MKNISASNPAEDQAKEQASKLSVYVSSSPHVHSTEDVPWIMRQVIYALIPGALVGVYFFGIPALKVIVVGMVSCVVIEALWQKLTGNPVTIKDGSAALTGLLLAMNLPSGAPWWLVVIGSLVAIIIAKQFFGGIGNNPFNPALVGRVFLLISFPVAMTTWPEPHSFFSQAADAATGATPLGALKTAIFEHGTITAAPEMNIMDPFLGNVGGSLGEISALALILGASICRQEDHHLAYRWYTSQQLPCLPAYSGSSTPMSMPTRPFISCRRACTRYVLHGHRHGDLTHHEHGQGHLCHRMGRSPW